MILIETTSKDVFLVNPEPVQGERGMSMGHLGTVKRFIDTLTDLSGRHYQSVRHEEVKLGRCTAGVIYDVIVDLRPTSPTYRQHFGITLSAGNRRATYIPKCCAPGFPTLEQKRESSYCMSEFHVPASVRGFRWDDPAFKIVWPAPILIMSEKDHTRPTFFKNSKLSS